MKKSRLVFALAFIIAVIFYKDFTLLGKTPLPGDTLIGAYFPWLNDKWGYPVGVPVKNALTSDAFSQFYVWKLKAMEIYKTGEFPLWNKFSFSGTPFLATFHSSVLNPANILLLVPNLGWGLYILFSSIVSAVAMYFFIRRHVSNSFIQIICSLVFAFAGPMTTWAEFGTAVWAAAALPLSLLLLDDILVKSNYKKLPLFSLLIAYLFFAGHVQMIIYELVICFFYLLFIYKAHGLNLKKITLLFISALLGLGLSAIQLLPTAQLFKTSIRAEENYAANNDYGLSPIKETVRLIAADFYGHPTRGNHFSSVSYHEYSSYLGALTLPIILFYVFASKKKTKLSKFFLWGFFISIFLAIQSPLTKFIFSLPIPLLTYSSASRLFFVTAFFASISLGFSLQYLLDSPKDKRKLSVFLLASICLLPVFLLGVPSEKYTISIRNMVYYQAILGLGLISVFFTKTRIAIVLLLAIFIFDLSRYFNKYNTFFSPEKVFPQTPTTEYLQNNIGGLRVIKENTNILPANTWTYYDLQAIDGYDPLYSLDYARFFHAASGKDFMDAVSRYALLERVNPLFLDALSVKYLLSVRPKPGESDHGMYYDATKAGFKEVYLDGRVRIMENPNVLPKAYFSESVSFTGSKIDMYKKISEKNFNPKKEAIVLMDNRQEPTKVSLGKVINIDDKYHSKLNIEVSTKEEGFLVVSNNYDEGWKLKLNGNRSPVYQVNGSLTGFFVPEGDTNVELYYLPDSFILGRNISLWSLLLLVLQLTVLYYIHGKAKLS